MRPLYSKKPGPASRPVGGRKAPWGAFPCSVVAVTKTMYDREISVLCEKDFAVTRAQKGYFPPFRNNPALLSPGRRRLIREMTNLAENLLANDAQDHEIARRVGGIQNEAFADFVLSSFEVTGHRVERFSQFDEFCPNGAVQLGGRKYLVRGVGPTRDRDRQIHVSRALDRLALECRGRGMSGLFVSTQVEVKPSTLIQVGKHHVGRGFSLSMMCKPDVTDLLQGRCIRDPVKGFFLVYGKEFSAPKIHPHHAYQQDQNGSWWSPSMDTSMMPYPEAGLFGDEDHRREGGADSG